MIFLLWFTLVSFSTTGFHAKLPNHTQAAKNEKLVITEFMLENTEFMLEKITKILLDQQKIHAVCEKTLVFRVN